jgi:hypothetical protein
MTWHHEAPILKYFTDLRSGILAQCLRNDDGRIGDDEQRFDS